MSFEKHLEQIIDTMPSLPVTVAKILQITKDPASTPNDLNQVITLDPVLTGKVLRLVNSAYYNLSNQVTSIVKAIVMLGINTIKNLAVSTAVLGTMHSLAEEEGLNMDGFWRHCLAVGVTAKLIATRMNVEPKMRDEYFIAGLLHDIGKIVLNRKLPDLFLECIRESDIRRIPLHVAEEGKMEINHARVGAMVAAKWQLSGSLAEAITFHHNPLEAGPDHRRVVYTVSVANAFCVLNELGFSGSRYADEIPDEIASNLRISEEALVGMREKIAEELEKALVFLAVSERGA